jgi:calcineurin-like phosphoesterase
MRILFLGDIVGKPGVDLVCDAIPGYRREASIDIVIANAENSDKGSAIGRVFMKPADCPFKAVERTLAEIPEDVVIRFCDFHAEATSDKHLMGRFLDGKVTAVCGTHTHVTTADEQLFPGGTAYISDVGMSGPHESILGRKIERVMEATLTFRPVPFDVATDNVQISGVVIDVEPKTGRSSGIRRIKITEADADRLADSMDD